MSKANQKAIEEAVEEALFDERYANAFNRHESRIKIWSGVSFLFIGLAIVAAFAGEFDAVILAAIGIIMCQMATNERLLRRELDKIKWTLDIKDYKD